MCLVDYIINNFDANRLVETCFALPLYLLYYTEKYASKLFENVYNYLSVVPVPNVILNYLFQSDLIAENVIDNVVHLYVVNYVDLWRPSVPTIVEKFSLQLLPLPVINTFYNKMLPFISIPTFVYPFKKNIFLVANYIKHYLSQTLFGITALYLLRHCLLEFVFQYVDALSENSIDYYIMQFLTK